MKIHNFSAGPCILPQVVFDKMAQACLDFNNSGTSILEISHRRKDAVEVIDTARALVKELMNVPETHDVVFMQGGASLQFPTVAYNLLKEGGIIMICGALKMQRDVEKVLEEITLKYHQQPLSSYENQILTDCY